MPGGSRKNSCHKRLNRIAKTCSTGWPTLTGGRTKTKKTKKRRGMANNSSTTFKRRKKRTMKIRNEQKFIAFKLEKQVKLQQLSKDLLKEKFKS